MIVAPPAEVADVLYDKVRPAGSENTVDPVNTLVALSSTAHDERPAIGGATATDDAARTGPPKRVRASNSRNAPHTTKPNASSGLPAVFEPLSPNADSIRDRNPDTGAVTDGALTAGRLRIGAAASGGPPAGTHPDDVTDAAAPATELRDARRSAHRGTSATAVPEPSPPGTPPPTRASLLTPAATPGTTTGTAEFDGTDATGATPPRTE